MECKCFFADGWKAYSDLIPSELLIQTKSQTHLIESNNAPQRHWFARFRRKTFVVSRSLRMIELTVMLYAASCKSFILVANSYLISTPKNNLNTLTRIFRGDLLFYLDSLCSLFAWLK